MGGGLEFVLADVFSSRLSGGNQLAVFPEAAGLSDAAMATIARELKLNETVFVTGAAPERIGVRIFSPHGELPFAGHPVIGTACVLGLRDATLRAGGGLCLRVPAGAVPVTLSEGAAGLHAMLQSPEPPARLDVQAEAKDLADMLGLAVPDLHGDWQAAGYSAGVPFFCVALAGRDAVRRARLDRERWAALISESAAPHVYLFALEDGEIFARMFAPGVGIDEDPATGAAAVALGGFLAAVEGAGDGLYRYRVHQGAELGRPSVIDLETEVKGDFAVKVRIGGTCVIYGQGTLTRDFAAVKIDHEA